VKEKIQDSNVVAAVQDMKSIAAAMVQYYGDIELWPDEGEGTSTTTTGDPPETTVATGIPITNATVLRSSDAVDPVVTDASATGWLTEANTVTMSSVLTKNKANRSSWNGAYISKPELTDPWGHPFYAVVDDAMNFPGHENDPNHSTAIFVLSAGPNETIDTDLIQDMQDFTPAVVMPAGDDIVIRIR
jgi:hypothetical protein